MFNFLVKKVKLLIFFFVVVFFGDESFFVCCCVIELKSCWFLDGDDFVVNEVDGGEVNWVDVIDELLM